MDTTAMRNVYDKLGQRSRSRFYMILQVYLFLIVSLIFSVEMLSGREYNYLLIVYPLSIFITGAASYIEKNRYIELTEQCAELCIAQVPDYNKPFMLKESQALVKSLNLLHPFNSNKESAAKYKKMLDEATLSLSSNIYQEFKTKIVAETILSYQARPIINVTKH